MARYALIDPLARVVNCIEIVDVNRWPVPPGHIIIQSTTASIGDTWTGADFLPGPVPVTPSYYTLAELEAMIDGATTLNGLKAVLKTLAPGLGRIQKP